MIKLITNLVFFTLVAGCSVSNSGGDSFGFSRNGVFNIPQVGTFKSNQSSLILSLISRRNSGPRPNWELISENKRWMVYAVNVEGEVWFANKSGVFLRFNGWDFTEVKGLIEGIQAIDINLDSNRKTYNVEGTIQYELECDGWKKFTLTSNDVVKFEQNCKSPTKEFSNHIVVDSGGAIVEFRVILHPEVPPFFLKLI
mgnify:CR=1 FL=1